MTVPVPPLKDITLTSGARFTTTWQAWFNGVWRVLSGRDPLQCASFTVATLPPATPAGQMIYVSNEIGGATLAFSDGTNWRRVQDRAIVS